MKHKNLFDEILFQLHDVKAAQACAERIANSNPLKFYTESVDISAELLEKKYNLPAKLRNNDGFDLDFPGRRLGPARLPAFTSEITKYRGEQSHGHDDWKRGVAETYCLVDPTHNSPEGKKNKARIEGIIDKFMKKVASSKSPSPRHQFFGRDSKDLSDKGKAVYFGGSSSSSASSSGSTTVKPVGPKKAKSGAKPAVPMKTAGKMKSAPMKAAKATVKKAAVPMKSAAKPKPLKKNRPSPAQSATCFRVGTKKKGNDGNAWMVKMNAKGVHRWVKV